MAQLNDLLVMGQSTLLGPVNIKGTVTAEKFVGDGSGLENVSSFEVMTQAEYNALPSKSDRILYCIIG